MIHEGPLLEYGGRDLAFLQWAAAARHWLVLVLAAEVFLPHPHGTWWQLALLPLSLVAPLRRARPHRDAAREDADPARPSADRGRRGRRRCSGSSPGSWGRRERRHCLGAGCPRDRRRRRPPALGRGRPRHRPGTPARRAARVRERAPATTIVAAVALALRGDRARRPVLLLVSRTRETRRCGPARRRSRAAAAAVALGLALIWLVPAIGLDSHDGRTSHARPRRVRSRHRRDPPGNALPGARDRARRERARARGARAAGTSSLAIEIGVAVDLLLIALVAGVFHERIFAEFGAGDSAALRSLRD